MRSLKSKLILAFLVVSLVGTVVVAVYLGLTTTNRFGRYVLDQYLEQQANRWAEHYRLQGSWAGVPEASAVPFIDWGRPPKQGILPRLVLPEGEARKPNSRWNQVLLVDAQGRAVTAGLGYGVGEVVSAEAIARGKPITVNGKVVGFTLLDRQVSTRFSSRPAFLVDFYRALGIGALGATCFALLAGVLLAHSLTRPIRELTAATRAMAKGDLAQRIPVRSKDELGVLAESFNHMSAELARAEGARKQMTADIAHELRTPLSLILGHAEALSDGVLPPSAESFGIIYDEAQRLVRLVEDLRLLSLFDAGKLTLYPQPVAPSELLERTVAAYRPQAEERGIELVLSVPPTLPKVFADPDRMGQVLSNLLSNALRHTPVGGRVVLAATAIGDEVRFSVQDSGPGIAPEDLERVFDRFYRADKARSRDEGGSGLGLAISRSIVQSHGGRIWAESTPGQGATLCFTLPVSARQHDLCA